MPEDKTPIYSPKSRRHSIWENAVIYQIYPRSFAEVRHDENKLRGEGSLLGITRHLLYLKRLKIDVIWLSPFYPSPMKDGGYDTSDYNEVDRRYGNLDDFDELVKSAKDLEIKVMIDLATNHTSDKHAWFEQSRSSKDNPKSDWYIWRDGKPDGTPPNNWASVFSLPQLERRKSGEIDLPTEAWTPPVSAWTYDETRGQYYLHSFAKEQPDLNWQNPEVVSAIKDVMRFWINRGVDGFRADAINHIGKDPNYGDEEVNQGYREGIDNPYEQLQRNHSAGYPEVFYGYLKEVTNVLHEESFASRDLRIVFEAYEPAEVLEKMNNVDPDHASAFNFGRIDSHWNAKLQKRLINDYYQNLHSSAIPNNVNGNHDKPRIASRIGSKAARSAALINAMLPGQMFIYNGEELGMKNVDVPEEQRDDVYGLRDSARTPMQWSSADNAGFSQVQPPHKLWLPLAPDYKTNNVASQSHDPTSSLWLYRSMLMLRRISPILQSGDYYSLETDNENVMSFARQSDELTWLIVVNFSHQPIETNIEELSSKAGKLVISSDNALVEHGKKINFGDGLKLKAQESIVISI